MGLTGSDLAYKQARSGIERSGASRSGFFTYNIVVTISGADRSTDVQPASLRVTHVLNNQPDQAVFTMKAGAAAPTAGALVTIGLGSASNVDFGGQIMRVSKRYVQGIDDPFVDIECVDFGRLLDRRLVTTHYGSQSATDIANDLIDTYTSGFTRTSVATGLPTIDDFPVTNETVSAALQRLTNLIDGNFYDDGNRDVHLFGVAGDTSPKAGTNPNTLTTSLASLKSFSYEIDNSQIRTRVIVDGKSTTCPVGTPAAVGSADADASAMVDYLLVAGGGGGGSATLGGGGGAGGMLTGTDTMTSGSFTVTIGGGGASGSNGSDSSFNGHTATGGGAGGGTGNGAAGGSGGGGISSHAGGAGTAGQGNAGGTGNGNAGGAGGGGAGAVGGAPYLAGVGGGGGNGGAGASSSISGAPVTYAGGGGGNGSSAFGNGGAGGGGKGGAGGSPSTAGTANTGGGGGNSSAGGSGVCILSYPVGAISATGGTITTSGGRTIHTFTSGGTFTVATVTLTAAPDTVTDIPLEDPSQLDAAGGVVVIGTQQFPYVSVSGQIPAAGVNAPGTTLTAGAAIGDTSVSIASAIYFATVPGWAKIGDQYVRFTGQTAGSLTGIPALGFGAITAAVSSGTTVTSLGWIVLSTGAGVTFSPALSAGDTVTQRVIVDDLSAQATIAAIEGGDGIHEYYVQDGRLSVAGATARANAELADFSAAITTADWETEDMNARAGRMQAIAFGTLNATLIITRSEWTQPIPNRVPRRRCEAGTVRVAALLDAVAAATK